MFVPQKIALELLPPDQHIPHFLENQAKTLWCHVDVVSGGRKANLEAIDTLPALTAINNEVTQHLQSGWPGLKGGMQIGALDQDSGWSYVGTAGVAVQSKDHPPQIGFLTNHHVADQPGNPIYFPSFASQIRIGQTSKSQEMVAVHEWYGEKLSDPQAMVRCDCAYFKISDHLKHHVQPGVFGLDTLGDGAEIDLKSMFPIGQKVISVGRTRGFQRSTIVAYAYEFVDEADISMYTDLLIASETGDAFSWKGDSGKLILTDEAKPRPIGLLWGGWQERLRNGRAQEMWSYAVDLSKVLKRLDAEIYRPEELCTTDPDDAAPETLASDPKEPKPKEPKKPPVQPKGPGH